MAPLSKPPRVSVVMPNHNGGPWLAEAVDSVLAQTLADFELLVIDDGSTDGSPELLDRYARLDPRVKLIRQPRRGLTEALNRGLAAARAPLFARLDSDDIARPMRLQRQAAFLDAHPDIGLVGSWARQIDVNGRPRGERKPRTDPADLARDLERANPFVHSSIMARTGLLRGLGGYRPVFEAAEDYDLWLRLAEAAEVANLPEFLISYRMHDGAVSQRKALRQAFSVRLARGAAMVRRGGAADPAEGLSEPPDWACPPPTGAFYAEDAALFRLIETGVDRPGGRGLVDQLPRLNHAERRLAARALAGRIVSRDRAEARSARTLLLRLCRERPRAVFNAIWSLRT
jgi:GT2 family glycosyltransferase